MSPKLPPNMENGILVDSSVFIRLLRRDLDPLVAFATEFVGRDLVTCGIVRIEVVRGIKDLRVRAQVEGMLSLCRNIPTDAAIYDAATDLAWSLDRSGQVIPATDILIAVSALHVGASVLTLDQHFSVVPRLSMAKVPESWL